ncbi:MAG: hypothetical protein ACK45R_09425 [Candidatus Kapaibacterium sp.]
MVGILTLADYMPDAAAALREDNLLNALLNALLNIVTNITGIPSGIP